MSDLEAYHKDDDASVKDSVGHSIKEEDFSDGETQQVSGKDYDTTPDKRDMRRLGKKQELKRRFRFFSIVGYVIVLGLTWEFSLVMGAFSLSNGGAAGAIWLTLFVCCGMGMVMLSMAEMASMAPTSGGQYHWVSEFAPRHLQKPLSFAVGWLCALGWQAAMPSVAYLGAQQVLALISICNRDYVIQGWHAALITMAFVCLAIFFNTAAIGKLPVLEGLAVVLHIFGFFTFIVIFWVMGPRADAKETFTHFSDDNDWGSLGLATLIAMVGPTSTYIGGDSAVHLSEELKDASYILPRAMISAAVINYILGFVTTVTLMFSLGNVAEDLSDPSGQPWVVIVYRITGSKEATIVLLVIMIIMMFFCAVNQVTTSSRQVFALARDRGLPFHTFLARVKRGSGVPVNAVYVTLVFTCLVALIQIGSTVAFAIVLSVSGTGLFTSYITCITCVMVRRIRGEPLPASKLSLGTWGNLVNGLAICFLSLAFVFLFFPAVPNPTAATMNWAILIYGAAFIFAGVYYFFKGRKEYEGPVNYVRWQTKNDLNIL
ncbi:uncharacterized protein LTR77_002488 [Saxophila tyrrhenica]|uniref:Amino acid transporter n=1 Tax=Saxophila tyrrhenica TaxID=1690608 RepID=A0AAV9PJ11_9PEZI|nr:hypothetical protein LTR77_002488 [Saxophila tyrrhenica]